MEDYLSRAEELLKANDPQIPNVKKLLGEFHSVKDILFFKLGDFDQSIMHSEKAMELIPANEPYFYRESSVAYFSMAHQSIGKVDRGLKQIDVEFQTLAATDQYFKRRLLQGRCAIHLLEGSTAFMASDGAALISITSPKAFPAAWMMAVYSVTCSSYLHNHLDKVARFGKDLKLYRYNGWPFWVMHIFFIKCLSDMARGMWQEVDLCIGECEELADYLAIEPLKGMVQALKVESYLRRDDIESAVAVSPLANFSPHPPFLFYYIPQLTHVKLLIKTNQLEKGRELLDNLLVMGRQRHNKMLLVQALALQAVVHANESNHEQAKNAVSEALLLSKDQKNIRAFLDHGDAILHLLREMADAEPKNKQLTEIILALDGVDHPSPTKKLTVKGSKEIQLIALSERELEVLYLVTQGFKNNEIAEKLFVSLDTVKKHLYRAYQKLNVNNRVSAIKKVRELGVVTVD
jgi:DNA-binding CsgD family transcriptional regulator